MLKSSSTKAHSAAKAVRRSRSMKQQTARASLDSTWLREAGHTEYISSGCPGRQCSNGLGTHRSLRSLRDLCWPYQRFCFRRGLLAPHRLQGSFAEIAPAAHGAQHLLARATAGAAVQAEEPRPSHASPPGELKLSLSNTVCPQKGGAVCALHNLAGRKKAQLR